MEGIIFDAVILNVSFRGEFGADESLAFLSGEPNSLFRHTVRTAIPDIRTLAGGYPCLLDFVCAVRVTFGELDTAGCDVWLHCLIAVEAKQDGFRSMNVTVAPFSILCVVSSTTFRK